MYEYLATKNFLIKIKLLYNYKLETEKSSAGKLSTNTNAINAKQKDK